MPEHIADPRMAALAAQWRRWPVRIALGFLATLTLIAIYAPFIASDTVLLWWDLSGVSMPLLGEVFNSNRYPKPYDLVFNIAMFTLPVTLCWGWWRRWSWSRRLLTSAVVPVALAALAMLPVIPRQAAAGETTQWVGLWAARPLDERTTAAAAQDSSESEHYVMLSISTPVGHLWSTTYQGAIRKPPGEINHETQRTFWLGSDDKGRDVLAIMAHGARISLTIGFVVTIVSMTIGIVIGMMSGYFGGRCDLLLQRLVEIMMCFPTLILVLIVVAAVGRDIFVIMLVLGFTGWADTARLVRGEVLVQAGRDYVTACRAFGLGQWSIMVFHILPNCMTPILISAVFGVAGAVLGESGLSFIGLGDEATPSWGVLLNQGRENIRYGWLIWVPGLGICILVSSLYIVGDALRRAFDPKAI